MIYLVCKCKSHTQAVMGMSLLCTEKTDQQQVNLGKKNLEENAACQPDCHLKNVIIRKSNKYLFLRATQKC